MNGRRASVSDPSTWASFDAAIADSSATGVGFVLTKQDPFMALDLDSVLAAPEPPVWAAEILAKVRSYTEVSQSGKGLHVLGMAKSPFETYQHTYDDGRLELYYSARYIAMTGELWQPSVGELVDCSDLVLEIVGPARAAVAQPHRWVAATAGEIAEKCAWLAHARDDAATLPEPEWYAMLSIVSRCSDGTEAVHEWSRDHPKYSESETTAKAQRSLLAAGPRTCAGVIREFGDDLCHGCALLGKIKTPLHAIARPRPGSVASGVGQATDPATLPDGFHRTDKGNSDRIIRSHGREVLAYHAWAHPLVWDGRRWANGESAVFEFAKDAAQSVMDLLAEPMEAEMAAAVFKWAGDSESAGRLRAAVDLVKKDYRTQIESPNQFNRDPMLLNCRNGILDLRTGRLVPHDPGYMLTEMAEVDFEEGAECPTWISLLESSIGSTNVRNFLQRSAGYSLTGSVQEKCLFFLFGPTNSGKSTFAKTLSRLLGSYGRSVSQDLLMARSWSNHPTEIANLYGARIAVASETEEGHRLNEALVKLVTGGDDLAARRMREDFWTFTPTHKFWMTGNHKPVVKGTDDAIWRRLMIVEFQHPGTEDPDLDAKLKKESAGILAWALRGCLSWQRMGLAPPPEILNFREAYRREQDAVGQFLTETLCSVAHGRVNKTDLYRAYKAWAEGVMAEKFPLGRETFNRRVAEKGYETIELNGEYFWAGTELRPIPLEIKRAG